MTIATPEQALEAVQCAEPLEQIPEELRTPEVCLAACKRRGMNLADVPDGLKTVEMCMAAVARDPRAEEFLPESGGPRP